MEFIIGVGTAIVSKLAEYTVGFARRLRHYTSDVDNLRARVEQLNAERQNLQGRVDEASGRGEDIHDGVQNWLTRARGISQGATDFLNNNLDLASISCCSVQIPNLVSRRKLSREARQMVEDLQRQIQSARGFVVVASRPALHTNIAMGGDYKVFESRKTILEAIMKALKDRHVTRIGVYGIGGIGKTMLAKEVARQATEAKLFTEVAMTTVSQTQDYSRLQQDIAEKLKLNIAGLHTVSARADRLQRQLKEENSILIILDDIWDKLDLIEVGIHLENEGCKILMTSRSQDVLRSMDADKNYVVDDLSASEAMNLFRTIVGDIVEQRDINRLAIDVVRECGGLPLAITVVAGPLKSQNNLFVWRNTLNQLRSIISPTNIAEPLRKVYRSIRLSYDSLADEDKSLLLLCSLHDEDKNIVVEDLRTIGVGWGLFQNISTLADARTRVESLIVKLKDRCLLLDGDVGEIWVKMHDVIRDVAISIASNERGMHSVRINELEDCLNKKKLKDSKAISILRHPGSNQLPERLECSELELFLLDSSRVDPIPIQNHFFEGSTDQLKSLFLYGAKLVAPSSFHVLQNLQTLTLRGCVLEDVNFIGDLKHLQILDLSLSTIKQLPVQVAQLSRLQLLNLEACKDLKLIEPNVISSLIQLEELYISQTFYEWEVGEVDVSKRSNVNLTEIENLQKLTSLSLRVPDVKTFPKDYKFSEKLERYRISIGDSLYNSHPAGISRSLLLKLHERSQLTAHGVESLMKRSEFLSLDGLIDVKNVVYDLDFCEGFCDLKRLDLLNSDGVQYIVDCVDQQIHPHKAFPVLDSLRLWELRNLERICHGELPEGSFKNLREVSVWRCDKLKNVFPLSIFKRLHSIRVEDCKMMEEIVGHARLEDDGAVEFLELRSLELWNLPKMVKFMSWSEAEAAGGSSSVESPDPLICEKVALPNLENLYLYELAVKKLWADQLPSTSYMQNLSSLNVIDCNNLKYVSSFATAKSCLIKLKELKVSTCSVLEEVLAITDLQEEEDGSLEKILLPQLKSLDLDDLPNLKRFCKRPCELETLVTSIELTGEGSEHEEAECGTEEPLFSEMVALPGLEDLYLNKLAVKKLWADQIPATSYMQNLSRLQVNNCYNLKYVSSFATAKSCLIKLKELKVSTCSVLEEVIVITDLQGEEDGSLEMISLPQLKSLNLDDLPNLKKFCKRPYELETLVMSTELTDEGLEHEEVEFGAEEPLFSEMVAFPSLEDLYLNKLVVKKLWADQIPATSYMQNLSSLDVMDCNNLKSMSSFAAAKSFLIKLKKLQVFSCSVLEEVLVITDVLGEDDGSLEKISLPRLKSLNLDDLPNLKRFCKRPFEFETLATSTELIGEGSEHEEVEFGIEESLFSEMVELPSLEVLTLNKLGIKKLWADQLASTSYMPNLSSLCVRDCGNLKYVSSFATTKSCLIKLKKLDVYTCGVLEEVLAITDLEGQDDRSLKKISLPQLKSLMLYDLPYLKRFCKNPHELKMLETNSMSTEITVDRAEPEEMKFSANESLFNEMLEFPGLEILDLYGLNAVESVWQLQTTCYMVNLTSLNVGNCNSLKYLFSLAMAESLVKLKNLLVENCEVMEDIVVTEKLGEERRSGNKILFPQLESLMLSKLSSLRMFCNEEVNLPKLESLSTDWSEAIAEMLGTNQSSSTLSLCHRQLKELKLNFSHQDKPFALSICKLLQRCHNLEKLQLNGFLVNVICKDRQNEVGAAAQQYDGRLITRLRELRLDNVPKLRHLFGEPENDHPVGGALQPVKTLFVSISKNLTILEVSFCHRLTYLLASSTATSLVQLKQMRVTDCNRMTEIITYYREGEITEGEHDREFVFPQLEILVLRHLPNLGSFFSGNNVMRFPKLEKLFVSQCPEMRTFSHGIVISSSMLNAIITEIDYDLNDANAVREHWDGDVNTTVRQLWEDDSNLALQQLLANTDAHYSGEGTSGEGTSVTGC